MLNASYSRADGEDDDLNKKEPHDPVEAGKKAIEADRLINEKNKPESEQNKEEASDAEKWRNEG